MPRNKPPKSRIVFATQKSKKLCRQNLRLCHRESKFSRLNSPITAELETYNLYHRYPDDLKDYSDDENDDNSEFKQLDIDEEEYQLACEDEEQLMADISNKGTKQIKDIFK